ncbi:hypothetical protein, partial [Aliarcobacter butzleri]|uniref:hypothetical protein n=1 Tax=Aliarcobacter butzleri TaxID=28197 RepID=UPI003F4E3ACD
MFISAFNLSSILFEVTNLPSVPARGLIGIRTEFLTETKGEGVMNHSFLEFRPYSGTVESRKYG